MNRRGPELRKAGCLSVTDLELVRRARRGDEGAFHELLDRHAQGLYGLAFSLVGNVTDAQDVVQETLAGAFRGLAAFKERSSVKTWLRGILVNQAARCRRRRHVRKTVSIDDMSEGSTSLLRSASRAPSTSDLDIRMDVLAVLEALSPEHREVVVLREMQGMSYGEIADALGVPMGTVESRLWRARQELKERLKGYLP